MSNMRKLANTIVAVGCLLASTDAFADDGWAGQIEGIGKTYIMPAQRKLTEAINVSSSDPEKACQAGQEAAQLALSAQTKADALRTDMKASNADTRSVDALLAKLNTAIPQYRAAAMSICQGDIAAYEADPATSDVVQKIGVPVKAYNSAMLAAAEAKAASDHTAYCSAIKDSDLQLNTVTTNLASLRQTMTAPADVQGLNLLEERLKQFRGMTNEGLQSCKDS